MHFAKSTQMNSFQFCTRQQQPLTWHGFRFEQKCDLLRDVLYLARLFIHRPTMLFSVMPFLPIAAWHKCICIIVCKRGGVELVWILSSLSAVPVKLEGRVGECCCLIWPCAYDLQNGDYEREKKVKLLSLYLFVSKEKGETLWGQSPYRGRDNMWLLWVWKEGTRGVVRLLSLSRQD